MGKRDVGDLGELDVRRWCVEEGLVCNSSINDDMGWDFIIESPYDYSSISSSLDKAPYALRCFVQVKSTDGKKRSVSIKLTNWMNMVNHTLPSFVLFLEYDGKNTCKHAYLVHIGEKHIETVLKKLRELPENQKKNLNRKTLRVAYGVKDRLDSPSGAALLKAFRGFVGSSPEQYSIRKYNFVKNVGYGHSNLSVQFNLPDKYKDPKEFFIDLLIGIADKIDVIEGDVRDVRFGIQSPDPILKLTGGVITINPHVVGTGTFAIRSSDGTKYVRVEGEIFAPQNLPSDFNKELLKMRFASPFINLIMQPFSDKHSLEVIFPEIKKPYQLNHLATLAEFVTFFGDQWQKKNPYDIIVNGQTTLKGNISIDKRPDDGAINIFKHVVNAKSITNRFGIPENTMISISDIILQSDSLNLINHIYTEHPYLRVTFSSDENVTLESQTHCIPLTVSCIIGEFAVVAGIAIIGKSARVIDSETGNLEYSVETDKPIIHNTQLLRKSDDIQAIIDKSQEEIAKAFRSEHSIILVSYK